MRTENEADRYLGKLRKFGTKLKKGAEDLGAEFKTQVTGVASELRDIADQAKTEGRKASGEIQRKLKEEIIPKVERKVAQVASKVEANVTTTARKIKADLNEVGLNPEQIAEARQSEFALARREIAHRLRTLPTNTAFLKSEAATILDFDKSGKPVKGVPIFPNSDHIQPLKDDFFPVRIFLSADGLKTRVYRTSRDEHEAKVGEYFVQAERFTRADDLSQTGLDARAVIKIFDKFMKERAPKA